MARTRGLSLVELLAAIAIFLMLAGMVLQVLGGGLRLWSTGEDTRQSSEQAAVVLDRLAAELRCVFAQDAGEGVPRGRFLCDFFQVQGGGNGALLRAQRLAFVRRLFEERTHPALRHAGWVSGARNRFHGEAPSETAVLGEPPPPDVALRATGRLAEVCWFVQPDYRPGYEGREVLWRAIQSPIGGDGTLFQHFQDPEGLPRDVPAQPVAENLLHVGFEFLVEDPDLLDEDLALSTWDSTRGFLPPGDSTEAFRYARGPASLENPDDDVWPRAVRIRMAVEAPPGDSRFAELAEPLAPAMRGQKVRVRGGGFLRDLSAGLVKIDQEWVEIGPSDGRSLEIRGRGLFGTLPASHAEGARVQAGRWFQRVVLLPIHRQDLVRREQG